MIDLERLNAHSRQFARRLFRLWPEWIGFARYDPYEDFEKEALLVEVPCPAGAAGYGLFITTSEWEISVGFGENFHTRFGSSGDDAPGDFYDDAIRFIQDFVDERIVVATAWQDNEWMGAWKLDRRLESLDEVEAEPEVEVKIRSWLGTWDRDLPRQRSGHE